MRRTWCREGVGQVRTDLVSPVQQWPDKAEDHEEGQGGQADDRQPVPDDLTQRESPAALRYSDLATVGGLPPIRQCLVFEAGKMRVSSALTMTYNYALFTPG